MSRRPPDARASIRQLPLHLPATGASALVGATRNLVVQLLARLLISACRHGASEDGDETR
jgi:hypothetical protein